MKKSIFAIVFVLLGGFIWLLLAHKDDKPLSAQNRVNGASPAPVIKTQKKNSDLSSNLTGIMAAKYPRWEGGRSTDLSDPRWRVRRERQSLDAAWRGKIEIEFYGKVVDENNLPLEDAVIRFSKGDLSSAGTTQLEQRSDVSGRVSLTGVLGRGMSATAEKQGYYASRLDRHYFEYAEFSDENFYQPDPSNPVVFHLRKRQDADPLIYHEQELKVSIGTASDVVLDAGARLSIELLNNPKPKEGPWSARLGLSNGGLQSTAEEFPFTAPVDNYRSVLTIDDNTTKAPTWEELYQGGTFYFKTGENYGRIEIQMISGRDWLRVKTWLNPKLGSRNLEFDPAKVVGVKP